MAVSFGPRSIRDILLSRITSDPAIRDGTPIIRGHDVPVERVLAMLSAGVSPDAILLAYPGLEIADIGACLAYARRESS